MAVLTSTASPEWTTSSDQTGYTVDNLGDVGISSDSGWRWASGGGAPFPQWVQRDLGSPKEADYYVLAPGLYSSNQDPTAWELRGSNDGFATYDVLDTQSAQTFGGQPKRYPIASPGSYQAYRLHITANNGDGTTSLSEFQIGGGSTHTLFEGCGATPDVNSANVSLGITFTPTEDGSITHLIYYEVAGATGTSLLRLYGPDGAVMAAAVHATTGSSGVRKVALPTPVPVVAGTYYMVAVDNYTKFARWTLPGNGLAVDYLFGSLRVARDGTGLVGANTGNGRYGNPGERPDNTYLSSPYAVAATFVASPPAGEGGGSLFGEDAVEALSLGPDPVEAVYLGSSQVWPAAGEPEPSFETIPGRIMHLRAKDTVGAEGADITYWPDAHVPGLTHNPTNAYMKARPTDTPNGGRAARFDTGYLTPSRTNIMSSDVEVASLTASSQFNSGYPPSSVAARYGDWATSGFNSPEWFRVRLVAPKAISAYSLYSDLGGRSPLNWNLRASQDGVTWDVLDSRAGTPPAGLQTYTFSNTTEYLYYELQFTAINGGDLLYMRRIDLGGINFNGSPLAAADCFLVLRSLGSGSGHPLSLGGGDTRYPFSDGWIYSAFGGGRIAYGPTLDVAQWRIYRIRYLAGAHTEWLDGVQQYHSSGVGGPAWTTNGPLVGTGNNVPCYMDLAEMVLFNHALTTDEVTMVYDYLTAEHFT